jgi:hypothetical protein
MNEREKYAEPKGEKIPLQMEKFRLIKKFTP